MKSFQVWIVPLYFWICSSSPNPKTCDYIHIPNGRLSNGYEYFRNYYFPRSVGQTIVYECFDGYSPVTKERWHRVTCTESGYSPEPKCSKQCHAKHLPNGSFSDSNLQKFIEGEETTFQCNRGFAPLHEQTITCTEEGWSPAPSCIAQSGCEAIAPNNGFFTERRNHFTINQETTYGCQSGFVTPEGLDRGEIQCLEEGWQPEPKCLQACPVPIEENIVFKSSKKLFLTGETLHYECKDGFETDEKTIDGNAVCKENGWHPNPTCWPIRCVPFRLEHGTLSPIQDEYFHGDVVKFSCYRRYIRVGPDSAQCYQFGWSPQPPKCKVPKEIRSCQQPPSIADGRRTSDLSGKYDHGEKVEYECNSGYVLVGSKEIECVDGKWTSLPSCSEACPPPPEIPNAINIFQVRNYGSGEEISFRCEEYFLLKGPQKIRCENGKWQTPPRCIGATCTDTPTVDNADIVAVSYLPAQQINFQCHEGFEMSGPATVICEERKWSELPKCEEKSCRNPPIISDASYDKALKGNYQSGETVTYICRPGFVAEGQTSVTCQRGKWSNPSTCVDANCRDTPTVDNADIVGDMANIYLPGQQVTFQCHEGFVMSGTATVTCEDRKWSELPRCEDGTCSHPPRISNGEIKGSLKERYLPLEKVRYQCYRGYSFVGPSSVTCENKQWTEAPQCRDFGGRCGRPPRIENGDVSGDVQPMYQSGAEVHYQCQNLYRMEGNSRVLCENGHWTDTPRCLDPCTATVEEMDRNHIKLKWINNQKLYSESGDQIEFICKQGYRLDPSSPPLRARCTQGNVVYPRCIQGE